MASKVSGVIEKIQTGGSSGTTHAIASTAYGYCTNAASEQDKTVEMTGFKLKDGVTVHVKFQYANTNVSPKLNVNSTGAKAISFGTVSADIDGNVIGWHEGDIVEFTYDEDSTKWVVNNAAYAARAGSVISGNIQPILSKTFSTGLYGADGTGTHYYETVGTITPTAYEQVWKIHYLITSEVSGDTTYTYKSDVTFFGVRNTYTSYAIFNSFYSKYPIYQHVLFEGSSSSYPHEFGYRLADSYGATNVVKQIKFEIIEMLNCTVTFFNSPKAYKSDAVTNYTWRTFNATSNGLQETGDNDTTGRDYSHSGYGINGPDFRLAYCTIFGYDRNQKAQGISLYESEYTGNTQNLNVNRVYNTAGFDWTRGLWYSGAGNAAKNANLNFSPAEFYYAADLRYTDNCFLHKTTVSELGLVARKPVYFHGTIGADGLFYLAPITVTHNGADYQRAWTQDIPNTADGYVYWFIGYPYFNSNYEASGYQVNLVTENKLYWYHDGKFQEYFEASVADEATHASDADTVNGLTVQTAVPTNALFTDEKVRTYSLSVTREYYGAAGLSSSYYVRPLLTTPILSSEYNSNGYKTGQVQEAGLSFNYKENKLVFPDYTVSNTTQTATLTIGSGTLTGADYSGNAATATAANLTTTENAIARYSDAAGTFDNSGITIDDSNNIETPGNITLYKTASGDSPSLIFNRKNSTQTDWKIYVTAGKLSFCSGTDASSWTERASFADNTGNFTVTGTMTATNFYGGGANITLGTASRAVVTDGSKKLTVSSVTSTELGYLSGVTSAIQTQLNNKMASSTVVNKVKTTAKANNIEYKVLGCNSETAPTSGSDYEAMYDTNITMNPSTGTFSATKYLVNSHVKLEYNSTIKSLDFILI